MGAAIFLLLLAVGALVGLGLIVRRTRAHTAIRLEGGRARLVRGKLPPGLLSALSDVARSTGARGRVGLRGQLDSLRITTSGLDEFVDQRVRNVVMLRKGQIRR